MRKIQYVKQLCFSLNTNQKIIHSKSPVHGHDPKSLFPHRYKTVPLVYKTHLSGPPMPKFEANMIYVPPSLPSSMKQCNKSTTVKFHIGTTFDYHDPEAVSQRCDTKNPLRFH